MQGEIGNSPLTPLFPQQSPMPDGKTARRNLPSRLVTERVLTGGNCRPKKAILRVLGVKKRHSAAPQATFVCKQTIGDLPIKYPRFHYIIMVKGKSQLEKKRPIRTSSAYQKKAVGEKYTENNRNGRMQTNSAQNGKTILTLTTIYDRSFFESFSLAICNNYGIFCI